MMGFGKCFFQTVSPILGISMSGHSGASQQQIKKVRGRNPAVGFHRHTVDGSEIRRSPPEIKPP